MFSDIAFTASVTPLISDTFIRIPRIKTARTKTKAKRVVNWQSKNRGRTDELQASIREWLRTFEEGFSVKDLASTLNISRQLCLYHLKKMAATSQLVMALEPCEDNGGLQFHVWANAHAAVLFLARAA